MIIKPDFYDNFKCIGGECSFTCCKEWKIAVDDSTASVWKKMKVPEGMKTRRKTLDQFTQYKDGGRVVSLEDYVCPFLNEEKLCRLVCAYGDEILSETCTLFPREKHEFADRTEWTLMPCCPEVVDILNEREAFNIIETEQTVRDDKGLDNLPCTNEGMEEKRQLRAIIMDLLSDENHSCQVEVLAAFYILSEVNRTQSVDVDSILATIPELIGMIEGMEFDSQESFEECHELFYDLTENYRKENLYRALLDELYESAKIFGTYSEDAERKFESEWRKYESLFHKFLTQEIYADLINIDSDFKNMSIRFQWIGLEYALIKHMCYLNFIKKGQLEYPELRNYIVLVCRMMGYEEEDIYEYLENSFEDIIWEWGYMALVIGK